MYIKPAAYKHPRLTQRRSANHPQPSKNLGSPLHPPAHLRCPVRSPLLYTSDFILSPLLDTYAVRPTSGSPFTIVAWSWRIWFECTFGLPAVEPWEKHIAGRSFLSSVGVPLVQFELSLVMFNRFPSHDFWRHGAHLSGRVPGASPTVFGVKSSPGLSTKPHMYVYFCRNTVQFPDLVVAFRITKL